MTLTLFIKCEAGVHNTQFVMGKLRLLNWRALGNQSPVCQSEKNADCHSGEQSRKDATDFVRSKGQSVIDDSMRIWEHGQINECA